MCASRSVSHRQLILDRRQGVVLQVEAGREQHHALRRDAVELVGVEIGVEVRDDVAELVLGVDDAHLFSAESWVLSDE